MDEVLEAVGRKLTSTFDVDTCTVARPNEPEGTAGAKQLRTYRFWTIVELRSGVRPQAGEAIPITSGLHGLAFLRARAVQVVDGAVLARRSYESDDGLTETTPFGSAMLGAFFAEGRVVGTIMFGSRRPNAFDPDDADMLDVVVRHANCAIERLIMAERLQASTDAMAQEVVNRARVEAELREQAGRLAQSNVDLAHFSRAVASDFQEPLRSVTGFAQLLERRYGSQLDDVGKEYVGFVADGARLMKSMFDSLLLFSRSGHSALVGGGSSAEMALEVARRHLDDEIQATGATIEVSPLPEVAADFEDMSRVMAALIHNAIAFRRPGSRPKMDIHSEATELSDGRPAARFIVRDDGRGVAAEDRQRIFGVFQRGHAPDGPVGPGIGLALCKKVVEACGGDIGVESEGEGLGSTFWFTVPIPAFDST